MYTIHQPVALQWMTRVWRHTKRIVWCMMTMDNMEMINTMLELILPYWCRDMSLGKEVIHMSCTTAIFINCQQRLHGNTLVLCVAMRMFRSLTCHHP